MSTTGKASLILIGRHGAGKTAVVESIMGASLKTTSKESDNIYSVTSSETSLRISETPGFFAANPDTDTCKLKLVESIKTSLPGPDAFGLVIKIGRFTAEEREMIGIVEEVFGEDVFRFTIVIFTKLDELTYDDMTLDEFLQDSTPELQRFLTACGGRYIGFDNTGDWETRAKYGERLVSMLKDLQTQNSNMVYTVAMLDEATGCQQKKEEEEKRKQEEEYRREKEEMKKGVREEIRREFDAKLIRETTTQTPPAIPTDDVPSLLGPEVEKKELESSPLLDISTSSTYAKTPNSGRTMGSLVGCFGCKHKTSSPDNNHPRLSDETDSTGHGEEPSTKGQEETRSKCFII
ncbi:GTPase IMAP family member 9-like [Haliotis rufescens]|uniref:GTPase IMAP family member 9-like n=1 Tax=Haliotis rufescens TaxID=6454 RepID=UPI00201E8551|nr:GTPase IMAP family member 9-like [Haliotis rufescens]